MDPIFVLSFTIPLVAFAAFFSGYCFGKADGIAGRERPGWNKIIEIIYIPNYLRPRPKKSIPSNLKKDLR